MCFPLNCWLAVLNQLVTLASGSRNRCKSSYHSAGLATGSSRGLAVNVHDSFQPVLFFFPEQQVSAALTVLTISTLTVNEERSPDFHGRVFERVPHPMPGRPNHAIVMGSVVPSRSVVLSVEVYGMAPGNHVGEGKKEIRFSMGRHCIVTVKRNFHATEF